jgi:hypothetical protein
MTDKPIDLNRWAAETLHGWVTDDGYYCHVDELGIFTSMVAIDKYEPTERIEQALECAEVAGERWGWGSRNGFLITKIDGLKWYVEFEKPNWEGVTADTLPLAIMTALYAAAKGAS